MTQEKIYLASDNFSAVHPVIMEAILEANKEYALPYGSDRWTIQAGEIIQHVFKTKPKVLILPTGTAANVLALKIACKRYESAICTDIAHITYQECGSAESIVGCKLLTVPHQEGKITPEGVSKRLTSERAFRKHATSPRVLSIAQPTEIGTVYTLQELKLLAKLCKEENLLFHMDGSRLYNAAVRLQVSLDEITEAACLDLLSLGGTKNALLCAESLLIFNPKLHEGSDQLHKQNLGLVSKMRYLSAQYIPFFEKELWHPLATQANQKAQEIATLIKKTPHCSLSYPVETNQIFLTAPASWIPLIQEKPFVISGIKKRINYALLSPGVLRKDVENMQNFLHKLSNQPR